MWTPSLVSKVSSHVGVQQPLICTKSMWWLQLLTDLHIADITGATAATPTVPPPTYGTLTCTDADLIELPVKKDCGAVFKKVIPGEPGPCTLQSQTEYDYVTVGTCTIHTFSTGGRAHCLNSDLIIKGVEEILKRCTTNPQGTCEGNSGREYGWSSTGAEGVRLVASPFS